MSKLNDFINWAIETCNADNVGYSTTYRQGQTVGGITYYDCSSFVSKALTVAGYFTVNPWFTTYNMQQMLIDLGFTEFDPNQEAWKQGDIMWTTEHTEIVYDPENYFCMGAHSDSYPLPDQVSISNLSTKNYWEKGYRPPTEIAYRWYATHPTSYQQYPLGSPESNSNAMMIYYALTAEGWTPEAIAGAVGNIQYESGMNPWQWEGLQVWYPDDSSTVHGYGLVQFTPNGKYINSLQAQQIEGYSPYYLGSTSHTANDGNAQILFVSRFGDWAEWRIPEQFKMTYDEYKHSTKNVDDLCASWLWGYEYPADPWSTLAIRQEASRYFYELYQGEPPPPPPPPPTPPYIRQSKFKIPFFTRSYKIY